MNSVQQRTVRLHSRTRLIFTSYDTPRFRGVFFLELFGILTIMKLYGVILGLFVLVSLIGEPVFAQSAIGNAQGTLGEIADRVGITLDPDPERGVAVIVGSIIQVGLSIVGVVFMGLMVYGGWLWMTAAGNQDRVTRAKDLLRDSVIGIVVVVTAYAITSFIVDQVLQSTVNNIPA